MQSSTGPRAYLICMRHGVASVAPDGDALGKFSKTHGGLDLVCAAPVVTVFGPHTTALLTLIEFPSLDPAREMLRSTGNASPDSPPVSALPETSWAVLGVDPPAEHWPDFGGPRGYAVARYQIQDWERFQRFVGLIAQAVQAYGGRFLVRIQKPEPVLGPADDWLLTIIEFPSVTSMRVGLQSPDFHDMVALGLGYRTIQIWGAAGVSPGDLES